MFAGPRSKARTVSSRSVTTVTFAMPPMFRQARVSPARRNRSQSTRGTSGAPSPPAAMSRGRKSATTGSPVRSAMIAGSAICSVAARPSGLSDRGWCRAVWPWEPIRWTGSPPAPGLADHLESRLRELVAEPVVHAQELVRARVLQPEDARAQGRIERARPEVEEAGARRVPCPLDLDQRRVDAVGARPGDETDHAARTRRPEREEPGQRVTAHVVAPRAPRADRRRGRPGAGGPPRRPGRAGA